MKLVQRLTDNYKKNPKSNIGKLLSIVDLEIKEVKETFKKIELFRLIDNATGTTLDNIGVNVSQKRNGMDDILYRIMLKVKIMANRSGGQIETLNDILGILLAENFIAIKEVWNDPLYENEPAAVEIRYKNFFGKIKGDYQEVEDDPWFLDGRYRFDGSRLLDGGLAFSYFDFKDRILEAMRQIKQMAQFIKTGGVKVWWCEVLEATNNVAINHSTEAQLIKEDVINQIDIVNTTEGYLESLVLNEAKFILDGVATLNGSLNLDSERPFIVHSTEIV